jgi:hypothetical protein
MNLSDTPFAEKKFMTVNSQRMAYIDEGEGDAIVFSHGNPTSSYLWRNIMPACRGLGRLVACDLIGQGDSDKLSAGPSPISKKCRWKEFTIFLRKRPKLSLRAWPPLSADFAASHKLLPGLEARAFGAFHPRMQLGWGQYFSSSLASRICRFRRCSRTGRLRPKRRRISIVLMGCGFLPAWSRPGASPKARGMRCRSINGQQDHDPGRRQCLRRRLVLPSILDRGVLKERWSRSIASSGIKPFGRPRARFAILVTVAYETPCIAAVSIVLLSM